MRTLPRPLGGTAAAAGVALALAACAQPDAPAEPAAVAAWATAHGIAPELVRVTEVEGFALTPQSVGVAGADGMSAGYADPASGAVLMLTTDRGTIDAATCPATPMAAGPTGAVTCEQHGDVWERRAGDAVEYVTVHDGALVRATSVAGADAAALRAAVEGVHLPTGAELDELPRGEGGAPVERGDLPRTGDGAPVDGVGAGG